MLAAVIVLKNFVIYSLIPWIMFILEMEEYLSLNMLFLQGLH